MHAPGVFEPGRGAQCGAGCVSSSWCYVHVSHGTQACGTCCALGSVHSPVSVSLPKPCICNAIAHA
eukprot:188312-Chlamydomonas_euryale.AAC.1